MPDFNLGGVGVHVGPDFTGFRAEADRELAVIERELNPVEVKLVADLMAGFRREAETKAKEALADARVKIDLEPNARGFKTETERLVKEVSAGINAEIRVLPKLAKDFKSVLRAKVDEATKASPAEITVLPKLSKEFNKELRAQVDKASENVRAKVQIAPSLTSDFRSKLKALVKEASADAIAVNVTVDPENVEDIRRKLREAVTEAARGLRVRVEVIPEVGTLRERLRAEIGALSVKSKVRVGADTSPFKRQLEETIAKAKAVSVVPIRLAVEGGSKALGAVRGVLGGIATWAKRAALGVGLVGIAVAAIGAAGLKSASDLEVQQRALQILLQSNAKGNALFKGVQQIAVTTPFEVPNLTPLAKQLIVIHNTLGAKNFSLDRILPSVKIVTDVSAALGVAGTNVEKVGLALGKIAGRGKLTSEELRSISKNLPGFSAIQAVATKLGITVPQAFDKVRAGAVDSTTAINAILEGMRKFPGAAGAAVKMATTTFKGALSNFPDILRNTFYASFSKELPQLTSLLVENGPLVKALNATLPAVAAAFVPLATTLFNTVAALGPALSILVTTALPLLVQIVKAVGALAPAFETLFKIAGPILKPIADEIFRVANVLAVVLVQALNAAKPAFKLLGLAVQGFLATFAQVATVLAPLIPLVVQIASVVVSTIGHNALPVAQAFAAAFKILAPVLMDVVRTIGQLFRALAPLVPVVAKVVAVIGEALVKAIAKADLGSLVTAVGDLVTAAGQVIIAFAPLIPVLVQVATILARELVPMLQVLAPIVTGIVIAAGPLLLILARLAPLLLAIFVVDRVFKWGKAMQDTFTAVLARMGPVGTKVFDKMTDVDWAGIKTKLVAGAAVASSAVTGVFAGMARDTTTQITSIAAAGVSIATAFATGGPVVGAIAAGAAVIGFVFGTIIKHSQDAKKAQQDYTKEVLALRDAFTEAGVDQFSSTQAKATIVAKKYLEIMKGNTDEAKLAKTAFGDLGVDFSTVATAAGQGAAGVKTLNDEIARATTLIAARDAAQSAQGIGIAQNDPFFIQRSSALNQVAAELIARGNKNNISDSDMAVMLTRTNEWKGNLKDLAAAARDAGVPVGKLSDLQKEYARVLQQDLASSPSAMWLKTVPKVVQDALDEQNRLADVQQYVANETDRQKGSAKRFSEAYDAVNQSLSGATTAYGNWVKGLQGATVPLADVKLGILDFAKQLNDLKTDTTISPFEKQQKQLSLVAQAQDEATNALGRFVDESGGNFKVFQLKVIALRRELIDGLAGSLHISKDAAAGLVDQILKVPDQKTFTVLADTSDAVTGIAEVQKGVSDYILSNINNKVLLDAADAKTKTDLLSNWIDAYAKAHPQAVAGMNIDDATTKAALVQGLLRDLDGKHATSYVDIQTQIRADNATQAGIRQARDTPMSGNTLALLKLLAAGKAHLKNGVIVPNAKGSVVQAPTITLTGEAGAEVILPLTDRRRMEELLRQVGVDKSVAAIVASQASGGGGMGAGIGGGAAPLPGGGGGGGGASKVSGTTIAWDVKNDGLDKWSKDTTGVFDTTTKSVSTTLTKWEGTSGQTVDRLGATMNRSLAGSLTNLASLATTGGAGVVGSLRSSLEQGTAVVSAVVGSYSVSLANALNPILSAVGSKTIPVTAKKFREGGVNVPRIADDGSYQVHVFAEKGTHGEAYIPFDPALRSNSRAIADETVRRLGGQAQWFRDGGVTGPTAGLNPVFLGRIDNFAAAVGQPYNITRGYASFAQQAVLYQRYLAGKGNLAAPPGTSMHNFGLATDGNHWASKHPELFGLRFPLLSLGEPWHMEPNEARAWAKRMKGNGADGGGIPGLVPIPAVPVVPDRGQLRAAALASMEYVRGVALDWAGKQSFGTAASLGIGDLTAAGVPVLIARALGAIRSMESGGNYTARNPSSTASGAYQFTNGTWGDYGGFPAAWMAPKPVQDAKAMANVMGILARYHGVLEAIPAAWYTGSYRGHGHLGYKPPGANSLTVQQYVDRWMARYASLPGYENGGLSMHEQVARISERNKPELILPLTKPSRVRELADQHGLTQFLMDRDSKRRDDRPNLNVSLVPPSAERPDTYAASLRNRLAPLMGS